MSIEQDEGGRRRRPFRNQGQRSDQSGTVRKTGENRHYGCVSQRKVFECDFVRDKFQRIGFRGSRSVRAGDHRLPEGAKAAAVYCSGKVLEYQCGCERGKLWFSGSVSCCAVWKDQEGVYRAERIVQEFPGNRRHGERGLSGQKVSCRPLVKEAWAELINEKQAGDQLLPFSGRRDMRRDRNRYAAQAPVCRSPREKRVSYGYRDHAVRRKPVGAGQTVQNHRRAEIRSANQLGRRASRSDRGTADRKIICIVFPFLSIIVQKGWEMKMRLTLLQKELIAWVLLFAVCGGAGIYYINHLPNEYPGMIRLHVIAITAIPRKTRS